MRFLLHTILITTATFSAGSSLAQEATLDGSKYQLQETENGFVRMNKETGAMSLCKVQSGNLVCRTGADERKAYLAEIESLEKRVSKLEAQTNTPAIEKTPKSEARKEFDRQLDKTMDLAKDAMRKFFGVIEDLKKEHNLDDKI